MQKKNKLRLGVVAAIAVAGVALSTMPAIADPAAGTFPTYAGVGSDTTQDAVGGLASVISGMGSYDAIGTANLQTRSGGPSYVRPNGSGNGVKALSASVNSTGVKLWNGVTITGQVDFARSSSGPSTAGTELTYIPFAKDAVSYAINASSDFPTNVAIGSDADTTGFTLKNIYKCNVTSFNNAAGDPITIRPLLPQTGSGTRSFWLSTLGLTETSKGACVTDLNNTVQEHSGAQVTGVGDIAPFSIAQFIAQGNHNALPTAVNERRNAVILGSISGTKPVINNAGVVELNTAFPVTRNVYNVVETARITVGDAKYDAGLAAMFAGTTSSVCSAGATIKQYGFGTIGALCGNTTTNKSGFTL